MDIVMNVYMSVVVFIILLFISYIVIEKIKSFLKTTTDDIVEQIQK